MLWPRTSQPESAANTDSRLMIRDATAGGVSFCPKICSVYPTPLDIRPVKSSGPALFKMSASVNVSVNSAAAVQRMPQTINCTHESATPFTIGEKRSMMRICTEKPNAHKMTSRSPGAMVKPSCTLNKYVPAAAITTLTQTVAGTRFLRNKPSIGTITM